MNRSLPQLVASLLVLVLVSAALAGQSVEIRMKSGAKWRGEIGAIVELTFAQGRGETTITGELLKVADLYVVVKGKMAGKMTKKTIFKSDIISIETAGAVASDEDRPPKSGPEKEKTVTGVGAKPEEKPAADDDTPKLGVFLLPLEGEVGTTFRHEEIDAIGEHADQFGPGQVIVLRIKSNGGLVTESLEVRESIYKLRERHRVVAWVDKALSAGCSAAMCCEQIYFMTDGVAGSVTTIAGGSAVQGPEQELHIQSMVDLAVRQGYSEHIARAMKASRFMCSYDKDEETGEVTFYGDMSGEHILSDDKSNLCFNKTNALHCGFSRGTADTEEDLAKLLQLPEWHEIDRYGRDIAKEWQETCERAEKEIPRIRERLGYKSSAGDIIERLGAQINLLKQLVRWWDRCPNVAQKMLPPKEDLERQIEELRRELARLRRNR
ncbi:MAG: hypothetical protein JSV91_16055 [Phycisphaerales bacterium]|nr:MAG: hypothetical protein JSV91_16055 [Phycisphaerales bacterium]